MAAPLVIFGFALLLLLVVSALFSAAETALTRASRGRMHQLEREGDPAAKRVNKLLDDQETMIGAVLLGYNLINILASAVATEFITKSIPGALGVAVRPPPVQPLAQPALQFAYPLRPLMKFRSRGL